ncbi:MAG: ribonuclease H-like domain-containing protein [Saprospiraceae bacterium]|nr:ribonuclease H-like domain-containing protein [Saprospiraceae bacterium]
MLVSVSSLKKMLFIDIETVSSVSTFEELSPAFQSLWEVKSNTLQKNSAETLTPAELYQNKAGIFAEFAKIVCISVGYLHFENNEITKCKIKSFAGDDEKKLLSDFANLLDTHYVNPEKDGLCGHNIKEFDIPFICRRMVIHKIKLPVLLDISGKKPWQTQHLWDTMDMWRFGDYKNYTSLSLLAATLHIETPKDDIDGSMVGQVYWKDRDVNRISTYCQKDVLAVAQIMLAFAGMDILSPEQVEFSS